MRSRIAPIGLGTLLSISVIVGNAPLARASSLNEIYVVASKLDLLPNPNAATSVIIHGAFFFFTMNGQYTVPKCGYMYFTCAPGSEALCRMQWQDVINISQNQKMCAGFGQQFVMTKATFYNEGD